MNGITTRERRLAWKCRCTWGMDLQGPQGVGRTQMKRRRLSHTKRFIWTGQRLSFFAHRRVCILFAFISKEILESSYSNPQSRNTPRHSPCTRFCRPSVWPTPDKNPYPSFTSLELFQNFRYTAAPRWGHLRPRLCWAFDCVYHSGVLLVVVQSILEDCKEIKRRGTKRKGGIREKKTTLIVFVLCLSNIGASSIKRMQL